VGLALLLAAVVASASGCGVRAYQREALSDRVMDIDADAEEESREIKWLEAREGSTGGVGGAGGGCACN
jgi:hypothetical protein